ncbi:MAG: serine/threonine protein kinase [Planctomycetaceae bacterium]|jgi:serine/threonine-protein kinase|nr:serine/threonine protein kinase [Planctomycetaceae bacterium]
MNDLSDREFGDYHIIRRIGSGTTADVFLAEQRSLGRCVALKILKKDLANDKTYLRRFVREAKAIAALNHPHLVQIYQTDCQDGYWFIAQEYVQGETLQQEIQRSGAMPIPKVLDILWQIASAFETAAEAGIVHRDIKPENILLGQNGIVKVTDFGLAHVKISAERSQLALTEVGMTLGTPLYMSPEQAQGHPLDHRSDIYSLGITCWHALTGRLPFTGGTALSVALQHVNTPPPPLLKQRSDIPPALAAVVERMIEKKPVNRFQTFHSILQELQAKGLTPDRPVLVSQISRSQLSARQMLQRALEQRRTRLMKVFTLVLLFTILIPLLGWSSGHVYQLWNRPLSLPDIPQHILKKSAIEEQWIYACFLDTPEVWQTVIDDFPDEDEFWKLKAKRQLIRYYFDAGDTSNSAHMFWEFAFLSSDADDQMLGYAGLAWCAAVTWPDIKTSQDYLHEYEYLRVYYDPDELCSRIAEATAKLIQQKKAEMPAEEQ